MEQVERWRMAAKVSEYVSRAYKVIESCVKVEQLDNAFNWALTILRNLYAGPDNRFFFSKLFDEQSLTSTLSFITEVYHRKTLEVTGDSLIRKDALFIQEIINDLERHGYTGGGKAQTMLYDWSRELKDKAGLNGQRKKVFSAEVGRENW